VSSNQIIAQGGRISMPDYDVKDAYNVDLPSTVLAALINNGKYENLYYGKNLSEIPASHFDKPWWFIKKFKLGDEDGRYENAFLQFDGINYKANIWLNGQQIASADTITGAFRRFNFDVSEKLIHATNVLAVEVFPPQNGDFTIGFVDWNPAPPDKNMGIFRPVTLSLSGPVTVTNPFVQSKINLETLNEARLTIWTELKNHSPEQIRGILQGQIEDIKFEEEIILAGKEKKKIRLNADKFHQLILKNPRLWWPNGYGEPNLYDLKLNFSIDGKISDAETVSFGIREVADFFNEPGHRGYKINGKEILITGGGWVDDLLLVENPEKLEAQIKYARHINLNTIRLEGFWGAGHTLYDLCDRYGILLMAGWSCHWEWEDFVGKVCDDFGGITTEAEIDLIAKSWRDQIMLLRNHPSIFVWLGGSDKLPRPELEKKYLDIIKEVDPDRPYLGAAATLESEVSGPTGVKMNGPYSFTPPIYWYIDKKYGGAFGFNTETGPGAQVPPLESIKKMIPEDHLWPIDDFWEYHCALSSKFNNLNLYSNALTARYGSYHSVEEFTQVAQVMNYELMRPMFEAFRVNHGLTTGIIQWMYNSAWPKMYWQLYDYYLLPNGAFYGAKKALEPLQLMFNYADKSIHAVNRHQTSYSKLIAVIDIWDHNSKLKWQKSVYFDIEGNGIKNILSGNDLKTYGLNNLDPYCFVKLKILNAENEEISSNFYWLSTKDDLLDFPKTEVYYTPTKDYADFKALRDLPTVEINVEHKFLEVDGKQRVKATFKNTSGTIAFFIELKVIGKFSGDSVLPIFWDDNYISLLPNEIREVSAEFSKKDLKGETPIFKYSGWNVKGN